MDEVPFRRASSTLINKNRVRQNADMIKELKTSFLTRLTNKSAETRKTRGKNNGGEAQRADENLWQTTGNAPKGHPQAVANNLNKKTTRRNINGTRYTQEVFTKDQLNQYRKNKILKT